MPQVMSTHVPDGLAEKVDQQIEENEMFNGRSDYIKYALRNQLQRAEIQEQTTDEN